MKVQSLIRDRFELIPVEVEISLAPGLPGIQFLGLADQHLKESAQRIKSAIRRAGFRFPRSQQILVNLRPSHLKKSSRGLELAVAAAYLWESEQVPHLVREQNHFIYGELSLNGDVHEPEDLQQDLLYETATILTGATNPQASRFKKLKLQNLKDLAQPSEQAAEKYIYEVKRPEEGLWRKYSQKQARLLEILAVGELSLLMAGPPGSGKSLLAQSLISFLSPPSSQDLFYSHHMQRGRPSPPQWRPFVKPHHTTPVMSMIGGGSIPFAGEISRAHKGLLILDELLEFDPLVQEALREPFEEGLIRVARQGKVKEYPARSLIIGTTNLCPCGEWTPLLRERPLCRFSEKRCSSYSQRLSGPIVDRFDLLFFTDHLHSLEIPGKKILDKIQATQTWTVEQRPQQALARDMDLEDIKSLCQNAVLRDFTEQVWTSRRRQVSTLRAARVIADLDQSPRIKLEHYNEALPLTQHHFDKLKRGG